MLATARITRPYGVKGYLRLESFSGETKHLLRLKSVVLEGESEKKRFAVEDRVVNGSSVLLKLEGIDSPESGRRYVNCIVWVDRRSAANRKRNEYYTADLTGCRVMSRKECIGEIDAVCETDSGAYLEVRDMNGETYVLPFSEQYFGRVNVKKKEIEAKGSWLYNEFTGTHSVP